MRLLLDISLVLAVAYLILVAPVLANTTVTNSVSVTAAGGESSAFIHSEVNGEVVESVKLAGPEIEYTSARAKSVDPTETERTQLQAIIEQLTALIIFYESILN